MFIDRAFIIDRAALITIDSAEPAEAMRVPKLRPRAVVRGRIATEKARLIPNLKSLVVASVIAEQRSTLINCVGIGFCIDQLNGHDLASPQEIAAHPPR